MSTWRYYSCDLPTGRVNARLPLVPTGAITRELSGIGTGTFTLPLNDPATPDNWEGCTIPKRATIVAEMNGQIVWCGIIGARKRDTSDEIELNCSSIESWFEGRYVDWDFGPYMGEDVMSILADLINHSLHTQGIPIHPSQFEPDPVTEIPRFSVGVPEFPRFNYAIAHSKYERNRDQRITDMIDDLASLHQGPEWIINTVWSDDPLVRRVEHYVAAASPFVGSVRDNPEWIFEAPGNIVDWEIFEDFSDGKYANTVVVGGEGEGQDRIMSTSGVGQDSLALDYGAPLIEYRYATQLSDQETVDAAAIGTLDAIKHGTTTAKIKVRADDYPITTGWGIGDTCRLKIRGGGYPQGYDKLWRIVGWHLDPLTETIEPTLNPWGEQDYA